MFQVEKARHVLLLRDKLHELNKTDDLAKLDSQVVDAIREGAESEQSENKPTLQKQLSHTESSNSLSGERERELATRCLQLLTQGRPPTTPTTPKVRTMTSLLSVNTLWD